MSTKTTFKRVALVAVAALGLGVLSVVPSSATASGTAVTAVSNGTATFRAGSTTVVDSDSTTAATVSVSSLLTTSGDTVSVVFYEKSRPATAASTSSTVVISPRETTTANTFVGNGTAFATTADPVTVGFNKYNAGNFAGVAESQTAGGVGVSTLQAKTVRNVSIPNGYVLLAGGYSGSAATRGSSNGPVGANFNVFFDSNSAATAGTYVYTVVATTYSNAGGVYTVSTNQVDVSLVVSANATDAAASAKTPAAANAVAFIGTATGPSSDAVVTAVATASTTPVAFIKTNINNTNGTAGVAEDSLTATLTGPGLICDGSVCGKSLSGIALTAGTKELTVRADGNAGVATINISSTVATLAAKTVTFYAKAAKTLTSSVRVPVLKVGANSGAVSVAAVDASGIAWTGTAYIYASSAADALIAGSETPAACSYTATTGIRCDITGKLVGTAKFKVIDAATVATATATSNEVTVTVSAGTPGSVKLAFDKSTYAPFEKAKITVTVLDTAGKALPAQTVSDVLAAGGITSSVGFSANSDTLTATSVVLADASSATTGAEAGSQVYYVYMPAGSGDVTISATGSTGLALAGRVAVSATATVVNSSVDAATDAANEATDAANAATDAALAAADAADAATAAAQDASDAVAALSASVSKLISSLRAQITSLTNLVIKIQKKVRA
jgi:trimeric autotransporter adhesin